MSRTTSIWCCACGRDVSARLTDGGEIYPHRRDLAEQPFWRCDGCGNHVGCHHKTVEPTRPLGNIPTPELRQARTHIHRLMDPLWKTRGVKRSTIYAKLTERIGRQYHTGEIRSIEEARMVYRAVQELWESLPVQEERNHG